MNKLRLLTSGIFSALLVLSAPVWGEVFEIQLERSHNLQDWETIPVTRGMLNAAGRMVTNEAGSLRLRIEPLMIPEGFSRIPARTFTMGSPGDEPGRWSDEGPQRKVIFTRSFYLQQKPVTWEQWNEVRDWALGSGLGYFMEAGQKGSHGDSRNTDDDPVTMVNWYDVVKWLNARSEMEGLAPSYRVGGAVYRTGQHNNVSCDFDASGYRLPTEAEWEHAARAGTTTAFYNGPIAHTLSSPADPNLDLIGWYGGNSGSQTRPVGQKQPNAWGLYDMSGNVFSWCWDWLEAYTIPIRTDPTIADPTGPSSGLYRVNRGGGWFNDARFCRSAGRGNSNPGYRTTIVGFRPARSETGLFPAINDPVEGEEFELQLERSHNLRDWETIPINPGMLNPAGRMVTSAAGGKGFFRLRTEPSTIPEGFSRIHAGSFTMGSPDDEPGRSNNEGPQHQVTLTRSFYLQQTSVTWRQWNDVRDWALLNGYTDLAVGQKGSGNRTDDDPVTMVNWYDVVKWLNARSEKEELPPAYRVGGEVYRIGEDENVACDFNASGYRLPTEAEWEYAARAGTTTAFYSGPITHTLSSPVDPNLDLIGWYGGNSNWRSRPVGQKQPNAWGLYDMSGNVYDWCWDGHRHYTTSAMTDPTGSGKVSLVVRGGSWSNGASYSRSAYRGARSPDSRRDNVGFRPTRG